jgi:hypothetical protein
MRFFGIRLGVEGRGLPLGRSLKRLIGLGLAALPLGLGFVGIVFDERRRGWQDRLAGVDVLYEVRERAPAPWSRLELEGRAMGRTPVAAGEPPNPPIAPSSGLRPQHVSGPPLGG